MLTKVTTFSESNVLKGDVALDTFLNFANII